MLFLHTSRLSMPMRGLAEKFTIQCRISIAFAFQNPGCRPRFPHTSGVTSHSEHTVRFRFLYILFIEAAFGVGSRQRFAHISARMPCTLLSRDSRRNERSWKGKAQACERLKYWRVQKDCNERELIHIYLLRHRVPHTSYAFAENKRTPHKYKYCIIL